jgi:hypothetical protein
MYKIQVARIKLSNLTSSLSRNAPLCITHPKSLTGTTRTTTLINGTFQNTSHITPTVPKELAGSVVYSTGTL